MTLYDAVKKYQYDVSINATINDYAPNEYGYMTGEPVWYWDINGGYCSVGGKFTDSPANAMTQLKIFLETFKPFEK